MLRLFPLVVGALALSRGPAPRAAVHLSDLQTVKDAKARLVKGLLYNKRITDEGLALIEELAVRPPPLIAGNWWTGRFVMSSSYLVADALKGLGMWRLLDGAPVSVAVMGERVELETDLLVLGCGTGLRVRGSLQLQSLIDGTDAVRVTLDGSEFFEPTEEVKEPLFHVMLCCLDLALTSPQCSSAALVSRLAVWNCQGSRQVRSRATPKAAKQGRAVHDAAAANLCRRGNPLATRDRD